MQFCYRGQKYESNSSFVKISQNKNILKYRGSTYQSNNNVDHISQSEQSKIVYRSFSINSGQEINFLGQSCQHKKIVLAPIFPHQHTQKTVNQETL